jgi:hypothetical protein
VESFHHKPIKKFNFSGIIQDDSAIGRLKGEYVRLLVSEMKLSGYVPKFELDPDFTIDYNEQKRYFEFEITVYGIYVGRKKSEWILGIDGNRPVYIQRSRSRESLQEQA